MEVIVAMMGREGGSFEAGDGGLYVLAAAPNTFPRILQSGPSHYQRQTPEGSQPGLCICPEVLEVSGSQDHSRSMTETLLLTQGHTND